MLFQEMRKSLFFFFFFCKYPEWEEEGPVQNLHLKQDLGLSFLLREAVGDKRTKHIPLDLRIKTKPFGGESLCYSRSK